MVGRKAYRLTPNPSRTRSGDAFCSECQKQFYGGNIPIGATKCKKCDAKDPNGESILSRRQRLYVSYLVEIVKKQAQLIQQRGESGSFGIGVQNDIQALEWRILEHRRKRIKQRLGMDNADKDLSQYRRQARFALILMDEIYAFNFKIAMKENPE